MNSIEPANDFNRGANDFNRVTLNTNLFTPHFPCASKPSSLNELKHYGI